MKAFQEEYDKLQNEYNEAKSKGSNLPSPTNTTSRNTPTGGRRKTKRAKRAKRIKTRK